MEMRAVKRGQQPLLHLTFHSFFGQGYFDFIGEKSDNSEKYALLSKVAFQHSGSKLFF